MEKIYFNPRDPGSLGGVRRLYNAAKSMYPNLTINDAKDWLSKQNVYTLHKPVFKNFSRNRIYTSFSNEQFEADIVDLRHLSRQNNGYKFILVVIDCFDKYLFATPLKSKSSIEVLSAFKKIFEIRKPQKLRTDRGLEFNNKIFKKFCTKNAINYFTTTNSDVKCAIVERVNRTLKSRMFRYFTLKGTRKYIDVLDNIVYSYNHSSHRSIGMAPADVKDEHQKQVFEKLYDMPNLIPLLKRKKIKTFKVGDTVRIRYDLNAFDKSFYPLWTDIVYKVDKIYTKLTRPQYSISLEGEQLPHRYYTEELQKVTVNEDSLYRVEKILRYRQVNGQKQALIKWKGYPQQFNQWIPIDQIQKL